MYRDTRDLTESGKFIEDTFNSMNEQQTLKEGEKPTAKIKFKNHIPGQGINNIFMNFNDPACGSDDQTDISCKIFCLNKIGPYPRQFPNHPEPTSEGCSPKSEIKPMTPAAGSHRRNSPKAQEMYYEGRFRRFTSQRR